MVRLLAVMAVVVGGLLAPSAPYAQARSIEIGVPPNRPMSDIEAGKPVGLIAEITDLALRRAGFEPRYISLPFARLYAQLAEQQIDGATSVFGTAERQRVAHYSTPIVIEYSILVVPKGRSFPFARPSDAAGKTIGTQTGFAYPGFDGTPGITFQPNPERANNLRLVALGRVDAAIIGSITGLQQARTMNLLDQMEPLPVAVNAIPLSIALNNRRFSAEDIARVNAALTALLAGPEFTAAAQAAGVSEFLRRYEVLP
jgi:ABC-type amino acid transport substrate-binding protein